MGTTDFDAVNRAARERGARYLATLNPTSERRLFVTISGAHIYGFPSADSDLDLRGAHVLPLRRIVGLRPPEETLKIEDVTEGVEIDLVTHDVGKYLRLLTRRNGYVLEQIFSPLVVEDSGHLEEIRALARGAMTRHLVHHYCGFYRTQERLILATDRPTAKAMLYLFRVLLTGIHLLRTGEVISDLLVLNDLRRPRLTFLDELVDRKRSGGERDRLDHGERDTLHATGLRLLEELETAGASSALPDGVRNLDAIDDFLVRVRLEDDATAG